MDSLASLLKNKNLTLEKRAEVLYRLAKNYLHVNSLLCYTYADSAIALAGQTDNKKIKAEAYSLQGVVHKNNGEFQKAIEKHIQALGIKEANKDTMGVAICYNDIGVLYKVMKNYSRAIVFYKKSNTLCGQINLGKGVAQTYNNIGTVFSELGNKDSAIVYYKIALSVAEEIKNDAAISTACSNIGEYYGNKGNNKLALEYFKRSLKIDMAEGNIYGIIMSYINIGGVYTQQKRYSEAIINYKEAERLCIENNERPMLKDLYWSMSQCYAFNNEKELGYDYLLKNKKLSDSLQVGEITKSILDVETKYQTEKKDLEIAKNKAELETKEKQAHIKNVILVSVILLMIFSVAFGVLFYRKKQIEQDARINSEIALQKDIRSKAIIEAEEKERIRIAKDLHDGVGQLLSAAKLNLSNLENSLQSLSTDQDIAFKNALSLVDDSVKEVRVVSHNMMPNTLLKQGLASAVREFITKIQNTPNLKVNLEMVGLNHRLEQEKESVLYRVIQELVSNIIKHAKASQLTLQIIKHDKELSIVMEDNGIGFDVSKINMFDGIGLKNIISRVEFINGNIHFDSTQGKGTTVTIEVPL